MSMAVSSVGNTFKGGVASLMHMLTLFMTTTMFLSILRPPRYVIHDALDQSECDLRVA